LATDDALAKGKVVISELGRCLVEVRDGDINPSGAVSRTLTPMAAVLSAPTPVIAGNKQIQATVTLALAHSACSSATPLPHN